jgi:hypothetical protein
VGFVKPFWEKVFRQIAQISRAKNAEFGYFAEFPAA